MKTLIIFTGILFLAAMPTAAQHMPETTVSQVVFLTADGAREPVLTVVPGHVDSGASVPILFAPGDRGQTKPMFFWGDAPGAHGWLIVHSERVYNGSAAQMRAIIAAAREHFTAQGFKLAGNHLIGWSANSGSVARHAAALGGALRSVSFIPGYGTGSTVQEICAHKDLRINFITGSRDTGWLRGATSMHDKLRACGAAHVSFTVIKDGGHVLREIAGEPLFSVLNTGRITR